MPTPRGTSGKIPPKAREKLDTEPLPTRTHSTDPREKEKIGPTRYGKREPKAEPDPGTRRDKEARLAPRH